MQQSHENVLVTLLCPLLSANLEMLETAGIVDHHTFLVPAFDALCPKNARDDVAFLGEKQKESRGWTCALEPSG